MAEMPKATRLRVDRMTRADSRRLVWAAEIEAGTPIEALLNPAYWAHVAHLLRSMPGEKRRPLNKIEVYAEDGAYYAELIVKRIGAAELFCKVIRYEPLEDVAPENTAAGAYEVKWRGPSAKWGVVRPSDGAVLKDGFADKDEAAAWMGQHLKAAA